MGAPFGSGPALAVAIICTMTFVKKQAPLQYARGRLLDPRYRGEGGGEHRCLEDPVAKVEDLRAAAA